MLGDNTCGYDEIETTNIETRIYCSESSFFLNIIHGSYILYRGKMCVHAYGDTPENGKT